MSQFEYKVIPTPRRPKRAKGVKGEPARFANVLTDAINEIAIDGWEFYKTEMLPMDAKPGFFSKRIETFQSVMVFRKNVAVSEVDPVIPVVAAVPDVAVTDVATPTLTAVEPEPTNAPDFLDDFVKEPEPEDTIIVEDAVGDVEKVTFDEDNLDPLKKAVEANRSSD